MERPEKTIIDTIVSNSIDTISDYSEVLIDSTLESGILKDIPIFGSIIKLTKVGQSINDFLFTKKILTFLNQINNLENHKRVTFIDKHLNNNKEREELGEKLLTTLDKVDSSKKANFIGKAFRLYLNEEVTIVQFYDLIYSIESFKIHYTELFIETCLNIDSSRNKINVEILDHFYFCGFLHSDNKNKELSLKLYVDRKNKIYSTDRLTEIGILFLEKILDIDYEDLKKKFILEIINIFPSTFKKNDFTNKLKFSRNLTRDELLTELGKLSLNNILKYSVSENYAFCVYTDDLNYIIKDSNELLYSIYNHKIKYDNSI